MLCYDETGMSSTNRRAMAGPTCRTIRRRQPPFLFVFIWLLRGGACARYGAMILVAGAYSVVSSNEYTMTLYGPVIKLIQGEQRHFTSTNKFRLNNGLLWHNVVVVMNNPFLIL